MRRSEMLENTLYYNLLHVNASFFVLDFLNILQNFVTFRSFAILKPTAWGLDPQRLALAIYIRLFAP